MPSENMCTVLVEDVGQTQYKCSSCHCLVDPSPSALSPHPGAVVCSGCRDHLLATIEALLPVQQSCIDVEPAFVRPEPPRRIPEPRVFDIAPNVVPMRSPEPTYRAPSFPYVSSNHHIVTPSFAPRQSSPHKGADPLVDITRLRVRSQAHHCLYPGATFHGTQKSGRNSYDVNVTIVDVDFASSFLCGYLRIRGLTDDWPELTTYFDAEIIGSRYGFLTQNWGATEQADMVHWSRFPAFRHVKNELKKPHMTMPDRDRGAVFMRWKERFLVPDHRVQDINGASFAGFYYVCVDFNPAPTHVEVVEEEETTTAEAIPVPPPTSNSPAPAPAPVSSKTEPRRSRRDSSARRPSNGRSPSAGVRAAAPAALMSGFYFHQNSEPYQQLTLSHLPERSSSSFEFR
ncbi:vacuolar import and degradation protein-domain-containing protein [Mycena rebaudengoi]|nr:vacuolar import and degradation protein-domain-containing protein [Mycena rebaudengoi]